jgi:hypothetical protein
MTKYPDPNWILPAPREFRFLFIALMFLIVLLPGGVTAQQISTVPLCLTVTNKTDHDAYGYVETDQFTAADGNISWHRHSFKINPGEPQDFCGTGPFFIGPRLRVVIKSLFPIYSCLAPVPGAVDIITQTNINGDPETVMTCPSEKAAWSN